MEELLTFFKTVSDSTRLKILKLLMTQPMCVCELMEVLRINQPCISQHLTILKHARLVKQQRESKWIVYRIDRKSLAHYLKELERFLKTPLAKIAILKKEFRRLSGLKNRGLLCQKLKCR